MHNRLLLYMLAAILCFDPAASSAWAAPRAVAAGSQSRTAAPLKANAAPQMRAQHQPQAVLPQAQAVLPQPQAVLPQPQAVLPQPQAVLPQAQALLPQPQAVLPQAQAVLPQPQALLPQPQAVLPQAQLRPGAGSPVGVSAAGQKQKPTARNRQVAGNAAQKQGISGFSSNPFALSHRSAPAGQAAPQPRISYGAQGRRQQKQEARPRLQVSGHVDSVPEDRLVPHRMALPGGPQTLSAMDHDPTPEVSMSYRLDQHTTTRVTINPQDTASPLYRPVENEGTVNSAGVYMNVDVQPDLQLQIGGEYCDVETRGGAVSGDSTSRGASVGLRWTF